MRSRRWSRKAFSESFDDVKRSRRFFVEEVGKAEISITENSFSLFERKLRFVEKLRAEIKTLSIVSDVIGRHRTFVEALPVVSIGGNEQVIVVWIGDLRGTRREQMRKLPFAC